MGNVVLGLLLMAGPQTIYALNKQFEGGVSLFSRGSLGSLRTALAGLRERGEVVFEESVEQGRSKKTYRPTPRGIEAFCGWINSPIVGSDVETQALARCFFLGLVKDAAARRAILDRIVTRVEEDAAALVQLAELLDGLDIPAEHRRLFTYQRATLDYGPGSRRYGADFFAALRDAETPASAADPQE
ncbi:MAG: helix-turn-helix transcriptional regulator [Frankiaceae bacterium]|jgi:DNA-binding PadR family transcriptional regulator|nr:helix-turn-helix transcriptional regulator [Frankiaceae bacterium]